MAKKATSGSAIDSYFEISERHSNVRTELVAGLSTYLSLAYIFIVTPAILSKTGLDPSAVLLASVIASALATIAMGLWANLPFAVAPGLEMSGFFAFVVAGSLHLTWQQGLGTVFVSGILCIAFTALKARKNIIDAIPEGLKKAIGTSVGVFVATIGLFLAHIVSFKDGKVDLSALSFGLLATPLALVLYVGLALAFLFSNAKFRFAGGLLIAILAGAALCWLFGIKPDAIPVLSSGMFSATGKLDLSILTNPAFWSPILVFFIIDFLGGIGKFIGLTANTDIQDENGNVPRIERGLYIDGAGTALGSLLGTSSLIAFVESAVGINAGGRTGLTALTCGVLMALTIVATPLLQWIPAEAASGVLVYVGYLLLPKLTTKAGMANAAPFDLWIALIMGAISFLSFSLDKALAFGFAAYFIKQIVVGNVSDKKSAAWLGVVAALLFGTIAWQWAA